MSTPEARYHQYVRYSKARGITPVAREEFDAAARANEQETTPMRWRRASEALTAAADYAIDGRAAELPSAALYVIKQARLGLDLIEFEAVQALRAGGQSWAFVGEALGTSRQAAFAKYAHRV